MQRNYAPINYGLPKLGNLIPYVLTPFDLLHRNQNTYQDIVEIKFRTSSMYLLTNPSLIEEVLVNKYKYFRKDTFLREKASAIFGNGLLTSDGELWLRHRRMMQPAFHRQRIAEYAHLMVEYTSETLSRMPRNVFFDIHPVMLNTTLKVVGHTLFSTSQPHHLATINHALECIMQRFGNNNWLNILEQITGVILNKKLYDSYEKSIVLFDQTIDEIIQERLDYADQPNDLLGMIIDSRDEQDQPMSTLQMRDECKTLFLAGHETTALNITWTMWLLHKHPKILLRLQREIRNVLQGRPPTLDDVPALIFTEKVIRESLRLKPPAWLTQREALVDIEIGGYLIPAGKNVAMSPLSVHQDPRWYSNPQRFDPDRWTEEFKIQLPRFAYFPFSGGPRLCIGQQFALLESTIILVMLIQHGEWQLDESHPIVMHPSITMRPKYGIRMLVK
jgi:cytochrome P450